jgi:hypothetical protein
LRRPAWLLQQRFPFSPCSSVYAACLPWISSLYTYLFLYLTLSHTHPQNHILAVNNSLKQ